MASTGAIIIRAIINACTDQIFQLFKTMYL